jgi:aconitate hydratase
MIELTKDVIEKTKKVYDFNGKTITYFSLSELEKNGVNVKKLPYSIRVLLENVIRNYDGFLVNESNVNTVANWPEGVSEKDVPYMPARVVLQDFTGVPLIVDLAAMRDAMATNGGDPEKINPLIPTDLVIDHSVQVDAYGKADALKINLEMEYSRNTERYELIKWAQKAFKNFRVVPPGSGIVHQVNLEWLASVVDVREIDGEQTALIDTCVGTDSHTPMINGLGVMGWGVGGIEAEAVMLGQPYFMLLPEVIGFKLSGRMPDGATATDLVLTVTEILRKKGVVGKFVEFFGPGLDSMSVPDRATISNMAPEYGATMGFFPVDETSLNYLRLTGRDEDHINFVRDYLKEQGLFRTPDSPDPDFTELVELDLGNIVPSISGPLNPEERVSLNHARERAIEFQEAHISKRSKDASIVSVSIKLNGSEFELTDGNTVIAAITSCTNTSNPSVMVGAGLIAKKAVEKGLKTKPWVKTSFAPGSLVVTEYLRNLGLDKYLDELKFHTVGYGCTSCIGNSGPLPEPIAEAITKHDIYATSVLSGNRNFSGRVHPLTVGNYLASPLLVVAYALSGKTDFDMTEEPIGLDNEGKEVYLKDIWPSQEEIKLAIETGVKPEMFKNQYSRILNGDMNWQMLNAPQSTLYDWKDDSTYIRNPPYFVGFSGKANPLSDISNARVLVLADDKISTDHISPAGSIAPESPAGQYLQDNGVTPLNFNSYGSRRGNHEVMVRGTFANVRMENQLVAGKRGWFTKNFVEGTVDSIYSASVDYIANNIPAIILAAKQYGQGSSRDWAAKGPSLLGIKAVIFKEIERIHRSNLIGMGILPLQFPEGMGWRELGLDGSEEFHVKGISEGLSIRKPIEVVAIKTDGSEIKFTAIVRIETEVEIEYLRYGGILQYVLAQIMKSNN